MEEWILSLLFRGNQRYTVYDIEAGRTKNDTTIVCRMYLSLPNPMCEVRKILIHQVQPWVIVPFGIIRGEAGVRLVLF
jgi:hypothetical protein